MGVRTTVGVLATGFDTGHLVLACDQMMSEVVYLRGCEAGAVAGAILHHDLRDGCEAGAVYNVIYGAGARRVRGGCDFTPLFARRVRGGCEAGAVYVVIYRAGAHTPFGVLKL